MQHVQVLCSAALFGSLIPGAFSFVGTPETPITINPPFPQSPIGVEWQDYFRVTDPLPNVTFPLGQSYAGNLHIDREGHPNKTLYFWGFEKSPGSLTAPFDPSNNEPWGIWLNGPVNQRLVEGPGVQGLLLENGPIQINGDCSASPNPYAWNNLADYFWLDQPAGAGLSTADLEDKREDFIHWIILANSNYLYKLATTPDQIGKDFMNFLRNLVKVFPSLATRPLHLTGEKVAGFHIPYILKAYFEMDNPPVKVAKIAISSGIYAAEHVTRHVPVLSLLETFPQIIDYNPDVYEFFKEQTKLCGFEVNLSYPQTGKIRIDMPPTDRFLLTYFQRPPMPLSSFRRRDEQESNRLQDRGLDKEAPKFSTTTDSINSTEFQCRIQDMMIRYVRNHTFPWALDYDSFRFSDASDAIPLKLKVPYNTGAFLNDPAVRNAIHAPLFDHPYTDSIPGTLEPYEDEQSVNIFDDLATNATAHGVQIILFSGNNDPLFPHLGTEIAIQNTTFGGVQGFTRKPSTPWYDDEGDFAGIVHQERGWTYALFYGAGNHIPRSKPRAAYKFLREFILGDNKTGLVTSIQGRSAIIGGEDPSLAGVIQAAPEVYYNDSTNPLVYVAPAAKREAWNAYIAAAIVSLQRREVASSSPWSNVMLPSAAIAVSSGFTMNSSILAMLIMLALF